MTATDTEPSPIVLSYSALTLHRKCPQAYYYRNVLGLRQLDDEPTPERDFGSWWGAWRSGEALERGRAAGSLVTSDGSFSPVEGIEFPRATTTAADVLTAAAAWWQRQGPDAVEAWQDRLGGTLPERLDNSIERWRDEYCETTATEHPIAVELEWRRRLPSVEDSPPVPVDLMGFVDEVYLDTRRGAVVVRDYKAHRTLEASTSEIDMMDSQLHLYAWGITPTMRSHGLAAPRAVSFDRMRSVAPALPAVTASGGLSKSTTAYDEYTYRRWAAGPDGAGVPWGEEGKFFASGPRKGQPKFGVYEIDPEVIEKLRAPAHRAQFFQRTMEPVSTHLVRSHLRAAVDTAADIYRTVQRAARTREAARNLTKQGCKFCDFAALCRAQMRGGPDGEYDLAAFGLRDRASRG